MVSTQGALGSTRSTREHQGAPGSTREHQGAPGSARGALESTREHQGVQGAPWNTNHPYGIMSIHLSIHYVHTYASMRGSVPPMGGPLTGESMWPTTSGHWTCAFARTRVRMHVHTHAHTHAHTHLRTHAHIHTHTHTNACDILM